MTYIDRLDAQQNDLDSLKSTKEGTAAGTRAARVGSQQKVDNPQASPIISAAGLDELAEEVRARVAKRAQQLPLFTPYSTDTSSDDEELRMTTCHTKLLKSGRLCTADTQVLRKVDWPHKFIYLTDGKAAEYEAMSVPLFVSGDVKIMDSQKSDIRAIRSTHLADLMTDSELYGWEAVPAFHAIWLQQMEQGRALIVE